MANYTQFAENLMTVSILEKSARALLTKNPQDLKAVADRLLTLVLNGGSKFTAPFFIVADALPDAAARVEAYRDAARYSASGSALKQQAVAGIVKHADALPDAAARVVAYRYAARYSASGSALEQQAVGKPEDLSQPKPARPAEIAAFVARFGTPAQK
jgi:hypothetical protein